MHGIRDNLLEHLCCWRTAFHSKDKTKGFRSRVRPGWGWKHTPQPVPASLRSPEHGSDLAIEGPAANAASGGGAGGRTLSARG